MSFGAQSLGLSHTSTRLLRDVVHERLGVFYDDERLGQLADRLAPLVVQRGFGSLLDYYYLLRYDAAGEAEWPRIADALAVNETYFWREIDQIRAVVAEVVPALVKTLGPEPLRIWSIPCATGEEPLTIAMALDQAGWLARAPVRILGSDASEAAVAKARLGRYRERSFRNLPAELRERYFTRHGDEWRVDETLHRQVTWDVVNLLDSVEVASRAGAPIVFCRNLFIYFSDASIRKAVDLLAAHMPPSGCLCVGATESLLRLTSRFELREVSGAFVYVRRGSAEAPAPLAAAV